MAKNSEAVLTLLHTRHPQLKNFVTSTKLAAAFCGGAVGYVSMPPTALANLKEELDGASPNMPLLHCARGRSPCWQPNLMGHGPLVSLKFCSTSPTLLSKLTDGFRLMVVAWRNVWMCSLQTPCALYGPDSIH